MFGGCLIFALGAALTYFTLDAGLPAVAFTYGFVSAFGQGIALIPTMVSQNIVVTFVWTALPVQVMLLH